MESEKLSAGQRIINACGGSIESGCALYQINESEIVNGLKETKGLLLKTLINKSPKKLKSQDIIKNIFDLSKTKNKSDYHYSLIQVIIDFIDYLLNNTVLKNNLHKISELLNVFVTDLASSKILDEDFYTGICQRSMTYPTYFHYYNSKNALFLNRKMPYCTQEYLSIFGLRQAMEIKFKRVIGLIDITPRYKMRHCVIPSILSKHESKIFVKSNDNGITIKDILSIYNWTNYSIHNLMSVPIWIIWKAFDECSILFDTQNDNSSSLLIGLDNSFQLSIETLLEMRKELTDMIQEDANKRKETYCVSWVKPEALICDQNWQSITEGQYDSIIRKQTIHPKKTAPI